MASPKPVTTLQGATLSPGMDRRVEGRRRWPLLLVLGAAGVTAAVFVVYQTLESAALRTLSVDPARLNIATVRAGTFHDYVPVRGALTPLTTVYLDAVEGGRVEEVRVEQGARVVAGQALVALSNTALQLDVISREAQVTEQLNNLRNSRLAMEQNRLALKRELVEIDYQIQRLSRLAERRASLAERGLISRQDSDETGDELAYYRQRRTVALESQAQDQRLRMAQVAALEGAVLQLERNLQIARSNLDDLVIKAPISGQLTALDAELGASKGRGERLGQIDDVSAFKVSASMDEFYVTRVLPGQRAVFSEGGREYALQVEKVYPEVRAGQFLVDLTFLGGQPDNIRRGQTLLLKIALSDPEPALLLEAGGFFRDTGGAWAFVLDDAARFASRRPIELGRRSPDQFEVLAGLSPGERVIVSEYAAFTEMDRLELNGSGR